MSMHLQQEIESLKTKLLAIVATVKEAVDRAYRLFDSLLDGCHDGKKLDLETLDFLLEMHRHG